MLKDKLLTLVKPIKTATKCKTTLLEFTIKKSLSQNFILQTLVPKRPKQQSVMVAMSIRETAKTSKGW